MKTKTESSVDETPAQGQMQGVAAVAGGFGLFMPSEIAEYMCQELERYPASEAQTALSVRAAQLRADLQRYEETRELDAGEKAQVAHAVTMFREANRPNSADEGRAESAQSKPL